MNNGVKSAGLNMLGAGFQDVGYNSIKLNTLKVTNSEGGDVTSGECNIQIIDGDGVATQIYSWKSSGRTTKTWGWKDMDGAAVGNDVVFARGFGMLFNAENTGDKLDSAGEVDLTAITVSDTIKGLNVIANPYPTVLKLNTLKVTNSEGGDVTSGECNIQVIDGDGVATQIYSWKSSGRTTKTWGWKDMDGVAVGDDVVFTAGDGILFNAENAGDKLIFPAK